MGVRPWIKSPAWDIAFIALPWLPFALVLFAIVDEPLDIPRADSPLVTALLAGVLALDSGHRYYTFPIAYADGGVFRNHKSKLLVAPCALALLLFATTQASLQPLGRVFAGFIVLWTFWHTVMQRIGFLRIYGGKIGGALRGPRAAKLDRAVVWSLVSFMLVMAIALLSDRLKSAPESRPIVELVGPFVERWKSAAMLGVSASCAVAIAAWLRHERRVEVSWHAHLPRIVFAASTACLLLLPLASPLIGAACLKLSHAVEYIAFVHVYEHAKLKQQQVDGNWFSALMLRPWLSVPLLFGVFCVGLQLVPLPFYLAALIAPLHFLYDGWIWKISQPDVARPLAS